MDLTDKQEEVLSALRDYIEENGYAPTVRELVDMTSVPSTSTATRILDQLTDTGYVERTRGISRGLRLTNKETLNGAGGRRSSYRIIPIAGLIGASVPAPTPDMDFVCFGSDESLEIDMSFLPVDALSRKLFALRVGGNSMIEAGIIPGDYVVLAPPGDGVQNGAIVAALLTDTSESTLKYYYRDDDGIRLQPANKSMEPIVVAPGALTVQGRVIMVLRKNDYIV